MNAAGPAILLAVGGGISAFKAAHVCSRQVQDGFDLRTVMTRSATQFLGPTTLAALSGKPVATESFDPQRFPLGPHIELSEGLGLMIVAPTTADLIAKFSTGIADDLLTTLYLQVECPVLLAPAMSAPMWSKPAVQRNVARLREDGCHFVGPDSGWLSCRDQGEGRMSDPTEIIDAAKRMLA